MKFPREWEEVTDYTSRLKVYGGWVVCEWCWGENGDASNSICFVPDHEHLWKLEEER
jgi:hypothetical protein